MMKMSTNSLINTTSTLDGNGYDGNAKLIQSLHTMSVVVFSLVSVLGVLGNGVVIWVTGFKMKKTVNTVWYLNLAVADFFFTAFLPLTVAYLASDFHWPFGKFMCKLNTTLLLLNMFVSVYILVVISVDRCVSVVWPIWAHNHRSVCKASCVSLCVWVVALILKGPYYFFQDTMELPENRTICFSYFYYGPAMIITNFLLGFAVPFTVIVSSYAVIINHLRRNRTLASQSRHSLKMIAAIVITFFFCCAPFHAMGLTKLVTSRTNIASFNIQIGFILANNLVILNSCMNPVLYVFIRQDFKDQVRKSILNVLETAFQEEEKCSPTEHQMEQIL